MPSWKRGFHIGWIQAAEPRNWRRVSVYFQAPHLPERLGFSTTSYPTCLAIPDPQENSYFVDKSAWNGRWLHFQLAGILVPRCARKQPLYITRVFAMSNPNVLITSYAQHLIYFHYIELATKNEIKSPNTVGISILNGRSEEELANWKRWIWFLQFSQPVCIQLMHVSKKLMHGEFSTVCWVKWAADFSPLPWGQLTIRYADTGGDINSSLLSPSSSGTGQGYRMSQNLTNGLYLQMDVIFHWSSMLFPSQIIWESWELGSVCISVSHL